MKVIDVLATTPIDFDVDGLGYRGQSLTVLRASGVADAAILIGVRTFLRDRIDDEAERLRQSVVTPGAGQAMEYQEAASQAFAALGKPAEASPDRYPMLAATVGTDIDPSTGAAATDVLGVARSVVAAYQAWGTFGAEVRAARIKGKVAIMAASTIEAACAAFDAIVWPAAA